MKKENFERAKWIPIFVLAVILMLIYKTIDNIGQITSAIGNFMLVISPLLYGVLFSYFIYIPHHAVEKLLKKIKVNFISKHARGFSTIIIFLVLIVVVGIILSFILPILFSNLISLANAVPGYYSTAMSYLDNLPDDSVWATFDIANTIRSSSGNILNTVLNPASIEQIAAGIMNFAGGVFSAIMGLVISLYILLYRDKIAAFFKRLNRAVFKREGRISRTERYVVQVNKVLFTFIASKGLDSVINFTVATTILFIFGVPYALLLGMIAGVFNFIPYIGSIISVFVITLITLITSDVSTVIPVLISLLIFQQIDGNFIEPRIMKSSLKINPILVILGVIIGGAYLGIIGMFLAVPIVVIVKQLVLEYITFTEVEKNEDAVSDDVAADVKVEEVNEER